MPRASFARLVLISMALAASAPSAVLAQAQTAGSLSAAELRSYARAYIGIGEARDQIHAELAQTKNKTAQAQQELREKLGQQIEHVLHEHALTEAEFERRTYLVSVEPATRKAFDDIVTELTGQPAPGQVPPPAANAAPRPGRENVPSADPVRMHVDHIMTSFGDTPNKQGLLATALAEARIAAQHAALAARNPGSLDAMKLHAGHVMHAIDPAAVATGPGQGYGVKKAAAAVATHIELAAKAPGAPAAVATHAVHIATSARTTVQRADRIVALAKELAASTTAEAAAALLNQIVPLTEQLIAGADANADGRIDWPDGEGGLQHVEEHLQLLLRAQGGR